MNQSRWWVDPFASFDPAILWWNCHTVVRDGRSIKIDIRAGPGIGAMWYDGNIPMPRVVTDIAQTNKKVMSCIIPYSITDVSYGIFKKTILYVRAIHSLITSPFDDDMSRTIVHRGTDIHIVKVGVFFIFLRILHSQFGIGVRIAVQRG